MPQEDDKAQHYYLLLRKKEFICTETEISRPIRLTTPDRIFKEGYKIENVRGLIISKYELIPYTYENPKILEIFLQEQELKGVKHFNLSDFLKDSEPILEWDLTQ